MGFRLSEVVELLGGELVGDGALEIVSVSTLDAAGPGDISFLSNPKYRSKLALTRASAVILSADARHACPGAAIVTSNPYLYFAKTAQLLNPSIRSAPGLHPSAVVCSELPQSAAVGANVFIGHRVRIGQGVVISANCSVGDDVVIGAETTIHSGVSIYGNCEIGERVLVHSGAVIGADGFGFARDEIGAWVKIPQIGRVIIGNDVEIGANTTIDRGALEDTVIGDGVKLDNQIQVGHNVHIGAHSALAGCVGIAGSARIGMRCTIGGGAIVLGHLSIADDVHVSAGTLVAKSIIQAGSYTGSVPFMPHESWLKNFSRLRHLDAMADKIRALEARLAALEQGK